MGRTSAEVGEARKSWLISLSEKGMLIAVHVARACDGKRPFAGEGLRMTEYRRNMLCIDYMPQRSGSVIPGVLDYAELEAETGMAVQKDCYILFGESLRKLRALAGVSGNLLAARLGINRTTYYQWERDEKRITTSRARHVALLVREILAKKS